MDPGRNVARPAAGVLLVALFGACAFLQMRWIVAGGPGVSPDSIVYMETARNLLAGGGFRTASGPMTHYPPVYPLLLAGAECIVPGGMLDGARFLCALFFGVSVVLLGVSVSRCTGGSLLGASCAMFFFSTSAPVVSTYASAWSEPPFIAFVLGSFLGLAAYVERPSLVRLVSAALLAGLACATRYAGAALLAPMVLAVLALGGQPPARRARDAVLFSLSASLPLGAWVLRNLLVARSAVDRRFAFHPPGFDQVKVFIDNVHDFFLPIALSRWNKALHLSAAGVLLVAALWFLRSRYPAWRREGRPSTVLSGLGLAFFVSYVVFVVLARTFFDAMIPFDFRLLLPALVPLIAVSFAAAFSTARAAGQRSVWYAFLLFAMLSTSINAERALPVAFDIHRDGRFYTTRRWRASPTLRYLARLADARRIYSNAPETIRFLAGREADSLPWKFSPYSLEADRDYPRRLEEVLGACREGKALIVFMERVRRSYIPTRGELEERGALPVLRRSRDGVVFGRPGKETGRNR